MPDNIFDMENISDIPSSLVKELNLTSDIDEKLLRLFLLAGRPIGLTQVIVSAFRKYGDVKTRQYYMTACYRLKKKGFLNATKEKGYYELTLVGTNYARTLDI